MPASRSVWFGSATALLVAGAITTGVASQASGVSTDSLIALDLHVVNKAGEPVAGLTAADFVVTVDAKPRPIEAAQRLEPKGVFIAAIDRAGLSPATIPAAREAVRLLMQHLRPEDALGLAAYPRRDVVPPTPDRQVVKTALAAVTGLSDEIQSGTRASQSLSGLESIIRGSASIAGHKTIVLITAGIAIPDGVVDTTSIGQAAAASDATLYVLYLNQSFARQFNPTGLGLTPADNLELYGKGLFALTAATGGTFYQLSVNADRFVEHLVKDAGVFYRLKIATLPSEHDGKPHLVVMSIALPDGSTVAQRRVLVLH